MKRRSMSAERLASRRRFPPPLHVPQLGLCFNRESSNPLSSNAHEGGQRSLKKFGRSNQNEGSFLDSLFFYSPARRPASGTAAGSAVGRFSSSR
jgi:hypothetical protein